MENMENNPKNWFVRILIILFCLGIASMIFFNFFCVEPYGEFKNGVFFLLSILLILVLAESFDNFSIGKIVSIKREIKNKEKENKKLLKYKFDVGDALKRVGFNTYKAKISGLLSQDTLKKIKNEDTNITLKNNKAQIFLEIIILISQMFYNL